MSFCLNVLINQKLLHITTNALEVNELSLCLHKLKSLANIYEVSITKDFVIVTAEEMSQKESGFLNCRSEKIGFVRNIHAYDWKGNHLWSIADIIGDTGMPLWGGTVTTKELLKAHVDFDESKCDEQCELYCCTAGSRMYIISLNSLKLLQILETR